MSLNKDLFGDPIPEKPKEVPVSVRPKDYVTVYHGSGSFDAPHRVDHPFVKEGFGHFSSNQANDILHMGTPQAAVRNSRKIFHVYQIPKSMLDVTYADSDKMSAVPERRKNTYGPEQQSLWETEIKTPEEVSAGNMVVPYLNQFEDKGSLSYMVPKHLIHQDGVRYMGIKHRNQLDLEYWHWHGSLICDYTDVAYQKEVMKKVALTAVAVLSLTACGTKTIVREVAPTPTDAPVTAPATNKYDDYVAWVKNNSGQANSASNSQIIETGDTICNALDSGRSIKEVADLMTETANTASDIELYAAVLYGAVVYLCPEYRAEMNEYLASV